MPDDAIVICRQCGFANTAGDQFCGSCGSFLEWLGGPAPADAAPTVVSPVVTPTGSSPDVPVVPAVPQPTAGPAPGPPAGDLVRCPSCGIANPATRTFCQSCGTTLRAAQPISAPSDDRVAAAVTTASRASSTVAVPPTAPRAAGSGVGPPAGRRISGWLVPIVALGLVVGVVGVLAGTLLRGQGPTSDATGAIGSGPITGSAGTSPQPSASTTAGTPTPAVPGPLALTGARASSVVGGLAKFQPEKAIDGDPTTSWQEGRSAEKGQWIEVSFAPSRVDAVVIWNGYQASAALFKGNLRLKDILVSVDGGEAVKARLKDITAPQTIKLGGISGATTVRITIVSTYASVKTSVAKTPFDDAAVSEIQVIGLAGG